MNIAANMEAINKLGSEVQNEGSAYLTETKKIYATIDDLRTKWEGADNTAYISKINENKPTIEALGKVINNYGIFLVDTAKNMKRIQDEIAKQAGKL